MSQIIYFLSSSNICRSQMAEGFAKKYLPNWDIQSAGIKAGKKLDPTAIKIMSTDEDIDISQQKSKTIDPAVLKNATVIVTLSGEARDKTVIPENIRWLHWPIDDPMLVSGKSQDVLAAYENSKDDIKQSVLELANYIKDHT